MLTDAMQRLVATLGRGTVVTSAPGGVPRRTEADTLAVWDPETLVFADVAPQAAAADLLADPACSIEVVDSGARFGFRFAGHARLLLSGPTFDRLLDLYRQRGLEPSARHMVLVNVEHAEGLSER